MRMYTGPSRTSIYQCCQYSLSTHFMNTLCQHSFYGVLKAPSRRTVAVPAKEGGGDGQNKEEQAANIRYHLGKMQHRRVYQHALVSSSLQDASSTRPGPGFAQDLEEGNASSSSILPIDYSSLVEEVMQVTCTHICHQYALLTHPINTPSHTYILNPRSQHIFSPHSLNPPSDHQEPVDVPLWIDYTTNALAVISRLLRVQVS